MWREKEIDKRAHGAVDSQQTHIAVEETDNISSRKKEANGFLKAL